MGVELSMTRRGGDIRKDLYSSSRSSLRLLLPRKEFRGIPSLPLCHRLLKLHTHPRPQKRILITPSTSSSPPPDWLLTYYACGVPTATVVRETELLREPGTMPDWQESQGPPVDQDPTFYHLETAHVRSILT